MDPAAKAQQLVHDIRVAMEAKQGKTEKQFFEEATSVIELASIVLDSEGGIRDL